MKGKKGFVLDCCNSVNSKLQPYQSEKDIYLAGYFALKRSRDKIRSGKNLRKAEKEFKNPPPKPYITDLQKLEHSQTTRSLPPVPNRKKNIEPVSKEEFQNIISKYRQLHQL
jgi:hypothetical protein